MSKVLKGLRSFLEGRYYPIFVGAVVLISHVFAIEVVCGPILVVSGVLVLLLCDSTEYTIPTMALFAYLLSRTNTPAPPVSSDFFTRPLPLILIAILGATVVGALVYFFIKDGRYKRIKLSGEPIFVSLLVFLLMMFVTSLFSGEYAVSNIAFSATQTCALLIPFFFYQFGISRDGCRGKLCDKLSYTALLSSFVIFGELIYLYITDDVLINGALNKSHIMLGWGISNCIGGMLTLGLPLLFLGAVRTRHTVLYVISAFVTYIAAVMTLSRNALLFGTLMFAACCILCSFFGNKKRIFRIITLTLVCILTIFLVIFWDKILEIFSHYVAYGFTDSGRFSLWKRDFDSFLGSVLVGVGFHNAAGNGSPYVSIMPGLPHNTPVALLGAGGILLFGAYAVYRIFTIIPFIKRPSLEKTLLGLSILALLGQSLLDNFFFNFYPTFMYTMAICIATREVKSSS